MTTLTGRGTALFPALGLPATLTAGTGPDVPWRW